MKNNTEKQQIHKQIRLLLRIFTSAGASLSDMLIVVIVLPSFVITRAIPLGSTADN